MKLSEFLNTTGESKLIEESRKLVKNPNIFTVTSGYDAIYDYFTENGPSALQEGPLDIAKLLKSKIYSKYGESNLGPNSMKIRTAFKFIGKNSPIVKMSGWDGGIITRDVINALTPRINQYFEGVSSGEIDPFQSYDWQGLYSEIKSLIDENTPAIQQRIDLGRDDKLPSAKAIRSDGELGATLAEFVAFLFIDNFKKDFGIDIRSKTKKEYVDELKNMKVFALDYIASTEKDIDAIQSDSEAINSDVGFRGSYTQ